MEIENIYSVKFQNSWDRYYGLLRNEKVFNLNDSVFVAYGNDKIFRGIIRGVTLQDRKNPEIIYKVEIPRGLVYDFINDEETESISLNCNTIFSSLEEAKQSRIDQINKLHRLELENAEKFFKQFEE